MNTNNPNAAPARSYQLTVEEKEQKFVDWWCDRYCSDAHEICMPTIFAIDISCKQCVAERFCVEEKRGAKFHGNVHKRWTDFVAGTKTILQVFVQSLPDADPEKLRKFFIGFLGTQADNGGITNEELGNLKTSFERGDYLQ